MFDARALSANYVVRPLEADDVPDILELCLSNPTYYIHCPPLPTIDSIVKDMHALPPHTAIDRKHYLGYFDGKHLVAVLDLILHYPQQNTAFIGFFMINRQRQGLGVGSSMIYDLCAYLKQAQFHSMSLGWMEGNMQAEHFWLKNFFLPEKVIPGCRERQVVYASRNLQAADNQI